MLQFVDCNKLLSIHPRSLLFPAIVGERFTHSRTMALG